MGNSPWGYEAYRDFMMCVWEVGNFSGSQMDEIVKKLHTMGHGFTREAMRQHAQKMVREKNKGTNPKTASDSGNSGSPAKPRGRGGRPKKSGVKPKAKPSTRAGTKRDVFMNDDGEDDEEVKTLRKRVKKENSTPNTSQLDDESKPSPMSTLNSPFVPSTQSKNDIGSPAMTEYEV
ncbi:uncharacterized protein F4822DRAFT_243096 [Hypoxylon trugodes]|uniref:uncharacterized protein n=1 Tax=Hypoxylon trugodes TaxID=326681 RepID=UPI00219FFADB|nr:uncharacterized protein F4822DRAFT_243096 [Hypoxylon trugodes]KAI1388359.1 hypothetical protein F4822DRAFT_243096 [Hypoxylon trugodes]